MTEESARWFDYEAIGRFAWYGSAIVEDFLGGGLLRMKNLSKSVSLPRTFSFLVLAILVFSASCLGAAAASPADPGPTAASVSRDLGLQTKLPTDPADKPKDEDEASDFRIHMPGGVSTIILVLAIGLGLAFAIYALRDTFRLPFSHKPKSPANGAVPMPPAAVERMAETGTEADELAAQGKLVEAMHILLLRSLVELRNRLGISLADSLTSREILNRLRLPDAGRAALADLIQRVEIVYFGKHAPAPDDYQACRASYERLTGAMIEKAAA